MKMPTLEAPTWKTTERTVPQSVKVERPDGTYEFRIENIITKDVRYIDASYKPGEGEVWIKIIQKQNSEKVTKKQLSATNLKEQDLKLLLIIGLLEYLLDNFSKS